MDSYVVRVYRRGPGRTRRLVGVVERIGIPGQRSFHDVESLWRILSTRMVRQRRPGPRGSPGTGVTRGLILAVLGVAITTSGAARATTVVNTIDVECRQQDPTPGPGYERGPAPFLHAGSASARDAVGPFRYDADLGKCVNATGEEGLNQPPPRGADPPMHGECADYRGRLLMYFQLEGANVRGANFDGAQFRYLNSLGGSDLTGANLRNVVADVVNLREANLSGADLSGARLRPCPGPDRGACVQGARFDARTILPFSREEALARGMVAID